MTYLRLTRYLAPLAVLLPLAVNQAMAELYRYKDASGHTVITRQAIPDEIVQRGYEILNNNGQVIKVVPPAPSPEEVRKQEAAEARAAEDQELRNTYGSLKEFDTIRLRQINEAEELISVSVHGLSALQRREESDNTKIAELQHNNMRVPDDLNWDLQNISAEREVLNKQIERQRDKIKKMKQDYQTDRARLAEIYKDGQ